MMKILFGNYGCNFICKISKISLRFISLEIARVDVYKYVCLGLKLLITFIADGDKFIIVVNQEMTFWKNNVDLLLDCVHCIYIIRDISNICDNGIKFYLECVNQSFYLGLQRICFKNKDYAVIKNER